ncbi:MAG: hypothetical protein EOO16_01725 [Chitinophagaceae bacterium]|nr:MAG: hypothetical protein EOO16_01725 [Chitinophagaceae bacterium]
MKTILLSQLLLLSWQAALAQHAFSAGPDLALASNFRTDGVGAGASLHYRFRFSGRHGIGIRLARTEFPHRYGKISFSTARLTYAYSPSRYFQVSAEGGFGDGVYHNKDGPGYENVHHWGPAASVTPAFIMPITKQSFLQPAFSVNFFRLYPLYNRAWWYTWFGLVLSYGVRFGRQ